MQMAVDYRNPAIPPFDTSALVNAYNACLGNQAESFGIDAQECAMEYLSCPGLRGNGLINNLSLRAVMLLMWRLFLVVLLALTVCRCWRL